MLDLPSLEMPLPDLSLDLLSVLVFGVLSSESFFKPGFLNIEEILQEHKSISTSYLQRKLRIGYPRAARIMEQLEEEGVKEEEG